MKIGLVRHFKVLHPYPKQLLVTNAEVVKWFEGYALAEIEHKTVDLCGIEWKHCYTSPLERAAKTAAALFNGDIIQSEALRELEILSVIHKKLRLPFMLWAIVIRIKSLSSNKITGEFKSRISMFVDELLAKNEGDVLIISHGFVMLFLQKELVRRGFYGKRLSSPENGKVYVFEK